MSMTEILLGGLLAAVGYFLGFVLPTLGKTRALAVSSHTFTHALDGASGEVHEHTYSATLPEFVRRIQFRRDAARCIAKNA